MPTPSVAIPMSSPKSSSAISPTTYTGAHIPTRATTCAVRKAQPRGRRAQATPPATPPARPTASPPASTLTSAGSPSRIRSGTGRQPLAEQVAPGPPPARLGAAEVEVQEGAIQVVRQRADVGPALHQRGAQ